MGLCKCPKRQVTNQFCFEHRVNVCENCMVTNHTKCIVQSYLQWLKDSDYNSSCTLCQSSLEAEDCVRLICYHVFHWACLNSREESLPSNTAPGGHTCPTCSDPIFPPPNLVSPVADVLRSRLGQVNWGRNELGLPLLLDEKRDNRSNTYVPPPPQGAISKKSNGKTYAGLSVASPGEHSVVNIDNFNQNSTFQTNSRRALLPREPPIGSSDYDDSKYKRRTPAEIFSRWSRRLYAPTSKPPWRRTWFLLLLGISAFILIIYLMAHFGRRPTEHDSMLEVDLNAKHYD